MVSGGVMAVRRGMMMTRLRHSNGVPKLQAPLPTSKVFQEAQEINGKSE
jgi:hypothetical protein